MGRANHDWSGVRVTLDESGPSAKTDGQGNFSLANVTGDNHNAITANAAGYLSAVCTDLTVTGPETSLLPISLLSGDIDGDDRVDVTDATAVGVSFGQSGPDLAADINRDGRGDILDIILVSINFDVAGPQAWVCQ